MNAESDGPDRRAAVEQFADALLGAVERVVDPGGERIEGALNALRHRVIEFVRRYHRLQIDVEAGALDEPVLFVANHGFGGVVDLNVMAVGAVVEDLKLTRPVTFLTHQLAWTLGWARSSSTSARGRRAGRVRTRRSPRATTSSSSRRGCRRGQKFTDRNHIVFGGRSGSHSWRWTRACPWCPS